MAWQALVQDEYGSTSIMFTGKEPEDAIKFAKDTVHEENFGNPLTTDEQMRHWEYCFVDVFEKDKVSKKLVYAGKDSKAMQCVVKTTESKSLVPVDEAKAETRIYLGNKEVGRNEWEAVYAADERGNTITDLTHRALEGKAFYFVRPL